VQPAAIKPPITIDQLGVDWYATRLEYDWQRPDKARIARTFARHGVTGAFWAVA
jgi:hypothetical protein